jgi:hypothetical protein
MPIAVIAVTAAATAHLRAGQVRMGLLLDAGPPIGRSSGGELGGSSDRRPAAILGYEIH